MVNQQRWEQLSFAQQLGHIGSELSRARHWEARNDSLSREKALARALELLDLSLDDDRWKSRLKEVARLREIVSAWFSGHTEYEITPEVLEGYCTLFTFYGDRKVKF